MAEFGPPVSVIRRPGAGAGRRDLRHTQAVTEAVKGSRRLWFDSGWRANPVGIWSIAEGSKAMFLDIVHLPSRDGSGDLFKNYPCVQVMLSLSGTSSSFADRPVWGLIDTGADYVFVDRSLFAAVGSTAVYTTTVNSQTSGSLDGVGGIFKAAIEVPPILRRSEIDVCAIDLSGWNVPYSVVLGRQFLAPMRLEYEPSRAHFRLSVSAPTDTASHLSSHS